MTDRELIAAFDPTARFFVSRVDDETLCVEFKPATAWLKGTATAADYAARIRRHQAFIAAQDARIAAKRGAV